MSTTQTELRLPLGLVTHATLVLLGLLTLAPLVWFWTAGERVVVGRLALLAVCALPGVGLVLFTVLACGVVTNRADEHGLDRALEHVSARIVALFDRELSAEIHRLQRAVPRLLARERERSAAAAREDAPDVDARRGGTEADPAGAGVLLRRRGSEPRLRPRAARGPKCVPYMGDDGKQRVCLSEPRRGQPARTPALDLRFREYFKQPKDGVLWRSPPPARSQRAGCHASVAQDEASLIPCLVDELPEPAKRAFGVVGAPDGVAAPYFLDRIDSVVGGQVATILAVNTGRAATPVATAGVSLNALDRVVPPRHIAFAVVDRETGQTLFHSDDDLAMTTDFVEDAGRDPALRSLLRSGALDTVDLDYAGVPIRAHVRPLRPGMPWTLVVYRGHELEDRLTGLTTALAIFFTLVCLVLTVLLAGLVLLAANWGRPGSPPTIPAVLGRIVSTLGRAVRAVSLPPGLAVAAAGLAAALLLSTAWISWLAWTREGGWRVLPFLAVIAVLAVGAFIVGHALAGRPSRTGDRGGADATFSRVLGVAVLIVVPTVLPAALWFGHHRAALGVALDHYLVNATLDSVERAREDYRLDMLRQHGAGPAPSGDRARRRWRGEPVVEPGWVHRTLRPIVASSTLANQLMAHRALPPRRAGGTASLHDMFAGTFGYDIDRPPGLFSAPGFLRFLAAGLGSLFFAALIAAHAYTICAACTVVGSRRRGLVKLRNAMDLLNFPRDAAKRNGAKKSTSAAGPLRAIVVYRSEGCRDSFIADIERARRDHRVENMGNLGGPRYVVDWESKLPLAQGEPLYVFDDLREVLEPDGRGRALLDELERRVNDGSHVLIWSRVVPDYRYSDRFGPSDRWFDRGHGDDADRRDRWSRLTSGLCAYVLAGSGASDARIDRPCGRDSTGTIEERRKSAASCFNLLWAESTHEEQLALYALARGGVVDSRRTAALSSLVTRGIVKHDSATGVVDFRSPAFREFIGHDIDHHDLVAWSKAGTGGGWRFIWPPLAIGGVLGLAFLAMANPEMRTTLLATLAGLVPVVVPLLRAGGPAGTGGGQ